VADDVAKKLWKVGVTKEVEGDAYVWAETQAEAEKLAESEVELDDYDGWTHAYAKEAKADRLKLKKAGRGDDDWDLDDRVFGDPPDGVGDTLGHALDWLTLSDEAVRSYAASMALQVPLFDDLKPLPLPCQACGKRFPAEPHAEKCEKKDKP